MRKSLLLFVLPLMVVVGCSPSPQTTQTAPVTTAANAPQVLVRLPGDTHKVVNGRTVPVDGLGHFAGTQRKFTRADRGYSHWLAAYNLFATVGEQTPPNRNTMRHFAPWCQRALAAVRQDYQPGTVRVDFWGHSRGGGAALNCAAMFIDAGYRIDDIVVSDTTCVQGAGNPVNNGNLQKVLAHGAKIQGFQATRDMSCYDGKFPIQKLEGTSHVAAQGPSTKYLRSVQ